MIYTGSKTREETNEVYRTKLEAVRFTPTLDLYVSDTYVCACMCVYVRVSVFLCVALGQSLYTKLNSHAWTQ